MDINEILQTNIDYLNRKEFYFGPDINIGSIEKVLGFDCESHIEYTDLPILDKNNIVMICNEYNIDAILALENRTNPFGAEWKAKLDGIFTLPFYIYYEDKENFKKLLLFKNIKQICEIYRIVIIVGEENLEGYFNNLDVLFPSIILEESNNKYLLKISDLFRGKELYIKCLKEKSIEYYINSKEQIAENILMSTAKIAILKNYYEPNKYKELYEQLKDYFAYKGFKVIVYNERSTIFRTNEWIHIYQDKPDIVVQINKSRGGKTYQGQSINLEDLENLVFINWLQDIHPHFLNKKYAKSLKERDYIFSLFDDSFLQKFEFKKKNIIPKGIMSVKEDDYQMYLLSEEEHRKYDCDISFVGSLMSEQDITWFVYNSLQMFFDMEQIERVMDAVIDVLSHMYDSGITRYTTNLEILDENVDRLMEELQCEEDVRMHIFRVLCVVRYNSMRRFVMEQLGKTKKYKIILYGAYDAKIEGVTFGGYIREGVELSKALQCSKMTMQINPEATMNQRVLEGILSNTMVLVYWVNQRDDLSAISNYLNEKEGFCYFNSRNELIELIDYYLENEKERKKVIYRGYHIAKKSLTSNHLFDLLLIELKKRMSK